MTRSSRDSCLISEHNCKPLKCLKINFWCAKTAVLGDDLREEGE